LFQPILPVISFRKQKKLLFESMARMEMLPNDELTIIASAKTRGVVPTY